MNRTLTIAYWTGVLTAVAGACFGGNIWVFGTVLTVYAYTHLLLRKIDQKEQTK